MKFHFQQEQVLFQESSPHYCEAFFTVYVKDTHRLSTNEIQREGKEGHVFIIFLAMLSKQSAILWVYFVNCFDNNIKRLGVNIEIRYAIKFCKADI